MSPAPSQRPGLSPPSLPEGCRLSHPSLSISSPSLAQRRGFFLTRRSGEPGGRCRLNKSSFFLEEGKPGPPPQAPWGDAGAPLSPSGVGARSGPEPLGYPAAGRGAMDGDGAHTKVAGDLFQLVAV